MPSILPAVVPAILVFGVSSRAFARSEHGIASVGWLAGCLEMRGTNRVVEERRMDAVLAGAEGSVNGKTRRIEFPFARVPCPTSP